MKTTVRISISLLVSFLSVMNYASAQLPDLTLISNNVSPTNLDLGQNINITIGVQNIGDAMAPSTHTAIYISPTTNIADGILLSLISLEPLPAGATSSNIQFVFPVPYNISAGTNYVLFYVDALNEVVESNENNNAFYSTPTINVNSTVMGQQNVPYPMIFIHGLNSNSLTWDSILTTFQKYYGWSYGGEMDFCLNQDGNLYTSDINSDAADWTNLSNLYPADFYTVNFDVDPDGTLYNNNISGAESNQSAIVKQGLAIQTAVSYVLQLTGRDKVILVGHSMGGLAAREYLQNSSIWQLDGQHHVAKLCTVGTPHGGSNSTEFGLGVGGVDEQSEAVRDLRTSYTYSFNAGVYLFGGTEDLSYMDDELCCYFYNADVNCNGMSGNSITGLNQKNIPNDLAYSCVIGTGNLLGGDGVVSGSSANLNSYYALSADTFILNQPFGDLNVWHTELTEQVEGNVQNLDEPYNQAYDVSLNQLYYGLITQQSLGAPYVLDYDNFTMTLPSDENLEIRVYNIPISQYEINVLDISFNSVGYILSNGRSFIDTNINLNAGQYYLQLSGIPDYDSWFFPYAFKLTSSVATEIENITNVNYFHSYNYPNPFQSKTIISFTLPQPDLVSIKIFDLLGHLLSTISNEQIGSGVHSIEFDGSSLASGVYFYTIRSGNNIETHKLIIEK